MQRLFIKASRKAGLPPGTLIHVGERRSDTTQTSVIDYDEHGVDEHDVTDVDECRAYKETATATWINVVGLHDVATLEKLGSIFDIHPLTLEDILNTEHRPKYEDLGHYLFVVLSMLHRDSTGNQVVSEQVSMIVGANFLISFQEAPGDVFNPVRERIRNGKGRIRRMGPDYLAYALLDAIVDGYYPVLENLGDEIESTEDSVVTAPGTETLQTINRLRTDMILLRRSVWPLREMVAGLEREDSPLVQPGTQRFLRDVYDHVIQVIDTIDSYRELVSGMRDTYLSSVSNRMNEVMKVLTIIATIFIPLTFIAGIYGMNFQHMPELAVPWAYPAVWGVMLGVAVIMVTFFRRRKWL